MKNDTGCILLAMLAAVLVFGPIGACRAGCFGMGKKPAVVEAPEPGDIFGAWVACRQFVEQRLRAPATAKFPTFTGQGSSSDGANLFTVRSYVDSQNAFGANLRTDFECVVKWTAKDRGTWILERIALTPR